MIIDPQTDGRLSVLRTGRTHIYPYKVIIFNILENQLPKGFTSSLASDLKGNTSK